MMNFKLASTALAAAALLSACGTVSDVASGTQTVQLSGKERFIRAIEGQGCVLSVDNIGTVLANASITADDMRRIVPELEAAGQAEVANDGEIRILSNNCI